MLLLLLLLLPLPAALCTSCFVVQFERVLLARSGVLLLAWSDPSGALAALRRSLQGRFPGACSKQSSIIHTSLFRIVEAPAAVAERQQQQQHDSQEGGGSSSSACCPLSEAAVAAVSAACERWTDKVRPVCAGCTMLCSCNAASSTLLRQSCDLCPEKTALQLASGAPQLSHTNSSRCAYVRSYTNSLCLVLTVNFNTTSSPCRL
jgi:hypothetical protein